jgi:hypothetical protein
VFFERSFLKSFANDGATVPKSRNKFMKWLRDELGMDFHPDNLKLKSVTRLPNNHEKQQVAPLTPRHILMWSQCLEVIGLFHHAIAFSWHLLINSAVRPKHLFASKVRLAGTRFEGICQLSRQRIAGRRRSYWWSAPTTAFDGTDLREFFETICEATGHLEDESMPLILAFLPPRSSLDKVTSLGDTIMTRSSFLRHSLFLLKARKIPTRLIESIEGLYATRRILPTLADIARLTPDQKLDVST